MHRCYFSVPQIQTNQIIIINDPVEIHHIVNVLRLKIGDVFFLFNGCGAQARVQILSKKRTQIEVRVQSVLISNLPEHQIILACAVPKRGKFETIVEKATELGVSEIIPLQTERTEVIWKHKAHEKKQERLHAIAVGASKQSRRMFVPEIHTLTSFQQAICQLEDTAYMMIPSLSGQVQLLREVLSQAPAGARIAVFIGPEGDFTQQEYQFAAEHNCHAVSLGPNILRVETAAICAVAVTQLLLPHTPFQASAKES